MSSRGPFQQLLFCESEERDSYTGMGILNQNQCLRLVLDTIASDVPILYHLLSVQAALFVQHRGVHGALATDSG